MPRTVRFTVTLQIEDGYEVPLPTDLMGALEVGMEGAPPEYHLDGVLTIQVTEAEPNW